MPFVYVPVQLQKGGKTVTTTTAAEEIRLRYDGWLPTGTPPLDHSQDVVRVADLGDSSSPARAALGTLGGTPADGSITPAKLSFDPATQAELDAVVGALTAADAGKAPSAVPSWVGARTGRYDPARSIYMPAGASLVKTRTALGQAVAGVAQCRLLALGDSTVGGTNADRVASSWPARLNALLANAAIPVGGTGIALAGGFPADSRWVFAGGFSASMSTSTAADGFDGASATTAGATATFTSTVAGTIMDIYYIQKPGAFTYSIDGAAPVSVPGGSATAWQKISVTGLANTTHTLVITSSSASQAYIMGAEVRATTGVSLTNFGLAGTTTAFWTGATWSNPIKFAAFVAPHLSLVCLGINDRNAAVATATYKTNLTAVITSLQASGDVILLNPNRINVPAATNVGVPEDPYYTALYDVADAKLCPVIDIADRMGPWSAANALGSMSDLYHPSAAGYAHIGRAVASLLTA